MDDQQRIPLTFSLMPFFSQIARWSIVPSALVGYDKESR